MFDKKKKATKAQSENDLISELKEHVPYGHDRFISLSVGEMEIHSAKNYDYASGGDPLGNFNRVACILGLYPDLKLNNPVVIALTYALKQLDQVLWSLSRGYEGNIEGISPRLTDVSVYAKLAVILNDEENNIKLAA